MTVNSSSDDHSVLLLSENSLQDSLLVGAIQRQVRVRCQLATLDNWRSLLRRLKRARHPALLLVDVNCLESSQLDDLLVDAAQPSQSVQVALMNVKPGDWPEERARWVPVNGLFYQSTTRRLLFRGVRALLDGELWLPRHLTQQLLQDMRQPLFSAEVMNIRLTPRERQLLRQISRGGSNRAIADTLNLSPHTVKTHLTNLYDKLGVGNRVEAANWARRSQFLIGPET